MTDLFSLAGKTAVITGSSRGIGRAIAEAMAAAGARVVVSSRKAEACAPVAEAIEAAGGVATVIPCNISHEAEHERLIAGAREVFGTIDILVLNAASNPVYGPMAEVSDAAFDKIIANNVRANMKLALATIPEMVARKDGAVIIVSSIAGMRGSRNLGTYAISKAADFQLARNLAVEYSRHNVRINCIAPGLIRTDFARALWEDERARALVERLTPAGRIGEPQDIAGIAVFLASPAARFVTGQTIVADGGVTIADVF